MKALKTTLGLFLLSLFLFSIAPQQAAAASIDPVADQLQTETFYGSPGELTKEKTDRKGDD